jgi:hypothetical protein
MKRSRFGIGTAALSALVLAGCHGTTQSTKQDAGGDARDAGGERASADVPASTDLATDAGNPGADGRDGLSTAAEALAETAAAPDAITDIPVATSADGGEAGPAAPDAAADVVNLADVPPTNQGDAVPDSSDAGPVPADDGVTDRPVTAADAVLDAAHEDANSGNFRITVVPNRVLDLVFAIDNSPSMAPKQAKLKDQFPKLIDALKDPTDGTLPDLRLAVIDSDLGSGGAYPNGSCGPKYGVDGGAAAWGDQGKFMMVDATGCGVTDANALWLEHKGGQPQNYTGDIGSVFSCLAENLGTLGCGLEHSLQAFEFALVASGLGNETQRGMLRPNAYLGLVFLTDEDDCSAAPQDGLFGDKVELRNESASLRCSTRAHACGGVNLTSAPPGYPTTESFSALFSTCAARTDDCPSPMDGTGSTDTSLPTACSPLRSIKGMADQMKALKARPDEQILVAGIFGWPLDDADLATATYQIAPIPNPNTADTQHPTVFDVWPICYDPDHLPAAVDGGTGFDADAAGWGATPGLRLGAFVDEFGDNGLKFSICQPDFSAAMSKIGATLGKKSGNLCVATRADNYAGCTARYLIPDSSGNLQPAPTSMPQCNGGQTNRPCYSMVIDTSRCLGSEQVVQILQPASAGVDGGSTLPAGTMLEFTCN